MILFEDLLVEARALSREELFTLFHEVHLELEKRGETVSLK